jgi:enoyl-CoA hydratase
MPMHAEYETIIYETADRTAWITLNRPDKRNAQNDELRAEMSLALERAGLDDAVHVVVITGSGDQAFSAGADIDEFPTRSLNAAVVNKARRRPHETIRLLPKPVIAMVNGLALGGGCELVLAADLAIAADTAKFGQPEIVNKVVPAAELRVATEKLVSDLLRNSPAILKIAKMAVNKSLDLPLTVGMDYERELFAMCFGTDDQKEGATAFLEKRKPTYTGR